MDSFDRFLLGYLMYRDFVRGDPPRHRYRDEGRRYRGYRDEGRRYRDEGPSIAEILPQLVVILVGHGVLGVYQIIRVLVKAKVAMKLARYRMILQ